jgi:hypothetical protein
MWGKMLKKPSFVQRLNYFVNAFALIVSGCALPTPPDGGPRDTDGPVVTESNVALGSTSVRTHSLTWTFDEYVVLNNPSANIRTSPPIPGETRYSLNGKTLKMSWLGDLEADRTYIIQFGNGVRDLHEGNPMSAPFWVFATGTRIDSGEIRGTVLNPLTGKPWDNQAVVLHAADAADSAVFTPPVYGTRTGKDGGFTLPYLAEGTYQIFAFSDPDGNLQLGTGEKAPVAWFERAVAPTDSLVLWLADPDSKADSVVPYRPLPADSSGVLKLSILPSTDGPWAHELRREGFVVWNGFGASQWTLEGLKPGTYKLQSFVDLNENGRLDGPNWWTRTKAEIPMTDPEAIEVTVGWTVERQWLPGASLAPETGLDLREKESASEPQRGGLGPIRPK